MVNMGYDCYISYIFRHRTPLFFYIFTHYSRTCPKEKGVGPMDKGFSCLLSIFLIFSQLTKDLKSITLKG
ncbi:conserved domain protein [Peptoniphilus sp. oral taxon 375 str. F0436]|nr:conserved domain protein [Peptoniphilus sp. oral taxon 375 str. F0436]